MRRLFFIFISLTTVTIFLISGDALAHGGAHKKEKTAVEEKQAPAEPAIKIEMEEESSLEGSIYGSEETEESSFFPDSDILTEDLMGSGSHEGMDMGNSTGHDMEQEIEIASHKMVSRKSKGYGAAVGITVLAGLVFGFLTLKRPFE